MLIFCYYRSASHDICGNA